MSKLFCQKHRQALLSITLCVHQSFNIRTARKQLERLEACGSIATQVQSDLKGLTLPGKCIFLLKQAHSVMHLPGTAMCNMQSALPTHICIYRHHTGQTLHSHCDRGCSCSTVEPTDSTTHMPLRQDVNTASSTVLATP